MSRRQEGYFRCVGYEYRLQMGSKDESMVSEQYETDRGCPYNMRTATEVIGVSSNGIALTISLTGSTTTTHGTRDRLMPSTIGG